MNFTSTRKLVLSALGHVVTFEKGETKFVPPALRPMALDQGLDPEAGAEVEVSAKPSDSERIAAVKDAMKALAVRNNPDDFGADNAPKMKAIEAITGGFKPIDSKERLALWAEVINEVTE